MKNRSGFIILVLLSILARRCPTGLQAKTVFNSQDAAIFYDAVFTGQSVQAWLPTYKPEPNIIIHLVPVFLDIISSDLPDHPDCTKLRFSGFLTSLNSGQNE